MRFAPTYKARPCTQVSNDTAFTELEQLVQDVVQEANRMFAELAGRCFKNYSAREQILCGVLSEYEAQVATAKTEYDALVTQLTVENQTLMQTNAALEHGAAAVSRRVGLATALFSINGVDRHTASLRWRRQRGRPGLYRKLQHSRRQSPRLWRRLTIVAPNKQPATRNDTPLNGRCFVHRLSYLCPSTDAVLNC
jgi:hypothetical protein